MPCFNCLFFIVVLHSSFLLKLGMAKRRLRRIDRVDILNVDQFISSNLIPKMVEAFFFLLLFFRQQAFKDGLKLRSSAT